MYVLTFVRRNPENDTAITAVENFANDLAARFSPIVGCTRSWDTADPTNFQVRALCQHPPAGRETDAIRSQVIIDNMMNLDVRDHFVVVELINQTTLPRYQVLFQAAKLNGNDTLQQIAISHADKTMTNHVRSDGTGQYRLVL